MACSVRAAGAGSCHSQSRAQACCSSRGPGRASAAPTITLTTNKVLLLNETSVPAPIAATPCHITTVATLAASSVPEASTSEPGEKRPATMSW